MKRLEIFMAVLLLSLSFVLFYVRGEDVETAANTQEKETSLEESQESLKENVQKNSQENSFVVVLDAGHGAGDSGKVGIHGELEKDINLSIVLYLKEELESRGVTVILTRSDDTPLYQETDSNKKITDMKKRIEIIEEANPDIVVSIHQNSYTSEAVKGPQVFYYETSTEGKELATAIQKSFDLVVGEEENRRSIKGNKDYYLLIHTSCPIVITECGFLSNSYEANKLKTEEYQKRIAEAVGIGIMEYLMNK